MFKKCNCKLVPINDNLIDKIWIKKSINKYKKFYKLKNKYTGQSSNLKVKTLLKALLKNKINLQFISASENVAWLLNIRGSDSEFTPIPNSYAILDAKNKIKYKDIFLPKYWIN